MDDVFNQRDDASDVRKDLAPFREGFVGAEQDGLSGVVASSDNLEEEIRVSAVVSQVADFTDAEQLRARIAAQATCEDDEESCAASSASMSLTVAKRTVWPRLSAC
jgi:hypothetical protein